MNEKNQNFYLKKSLDKLKLKKKKISKKTNNFPKNINQKNKKLF